MSSADKKRMKKAESAIKKENAQQAVDQRKTALERMTADDRKTLQIDQVQTADSAGGPAGPAARRACPHCALVKHYQKTCAFLLLSKEAARAAVAKLRADYPVAPAPTPATGGDAAE